METMQNTIQEQPLRGLKIGQLAQASGISIKTIRFYEESGVIPPAIRLDNGYRVYNSRDIQRLRFINRARGLGFSLKELQTILSNWDEDEVTCEEVALLLNKKLKEIEERIQSLHELKNDLEHMLNVENCNGSSCSADNPNNCCDEVFKW